MLAGVIIALVWLQAAGIPQQSAAQSVAPSVETGIRDALQRYSEALQSLDANAVRSVQPSIDLENLKRAFRDMRSLDVGIDEVKVLSGDATSARVSCRVTQTLTPRGGRKQTVEVTRVIRLRQQDDRWVIDSFER